MSLLIDGHNLIGSGAFEDISLEDEDDEARLVKRLRVWRSNYRGDVTVVFDRGIVGGASRELSGAGVNVIFARDPQEADDWIRRRIHRRQQGLTVVTNDWALRQEAKLYDVETWQADEFVRRMGTGRSGPESAGDKKVERGAETDVQLSDGELTEWMNLFGAPRPAAKRPDPTPPRRPPPPSPSRTSFVKHTEALRKRLQKKRRRK